MADEARNEARNEVRNEVRKEYIERGAARKFLAQDYAYAAADLLKFVPAADVVEVVKCKECKHRTQLMGKAPFAFYACSHNKGLGDNVQEDDFCSYGERKE